MFASFDLGNLELEISAFIMSLLAVNSPSPETTEIVKRAIDNAIELFDEIFYNIAPINTYNEEKIRGVGVPFTALSDKQCMILKELSGYLTSARRNLLFRDDADIFSSPASRHGTFTASISQPILSASDPAMLAMEKKMSMLRDYLVNELARSEGAEQALKKKEDELVDITAECEKLRKKLAVLTAAPVAAVVTVPSKSTTSTVTTAPTIVNHKLSHSLYAGSRASSSDRIETQPTSYVHTYVRKQFGNSYFFGIVAQYDAVDQYFQIVYEDADYEDLSHGELRRVLWSGSTPVAKQEVCLKHARLLNAITDEQYRELMDANKTAGISGRYSDSEDEEADGAGSGVEGSTAEAVEKSIHTVHTPVSQGSASPAASEAEELEGDSEAPERIPTEQTAATVSETNSTATTDTDDSRDSRPHATSTTTLPEGALTGNLSSLAVPPVLSAQGLGDVPAAANKVPPPAKSAQIKHIKQRPLPQHALITAHMTPLAAKPSSINGLAKAVSSRVSDSGSGNESATNTSALTSSSKATSRTTATGTTTSTHTDSSGSVDVDAIAAAFAAQLAAGIPKAAPRSHSTKTSSNTSASRPLFNSTSSSSSSSSSSNTSRPTVSSSTTRPSTTAIASTTVAPSTFHRVEVPGDLRYNAAMPASSSGTGRSKGVPSFVASPVASTTVSSTASGTDHKKRKSIELANAESNKKVRSEDIHTPTRPHAPVVEIIDVD